VLLAQVIQCTSVQCNGADERGRSPAACYVSRQKIDDDATLGTSACLTEDVDLINPNKETRPARKRVRNIVANGSKLVELHLEEISTLAPNQHSSGWPRDSNAISESYCVVLIGAGHFRPEKSRQFETFPSAQCCPGERRDPYRVVLSMVRQRQTTNTMLKQRVPVVMGPRRSPGRQRGLLCPSCQSVART
jgi:hypothetical protein